METNFKIDEVFLARWAENSLTAEELTFFKKQKEYNLYKKIHNKSALFETQAFDKAKNYDLLKKSLRKQPKKLKSSKVNFKVWGGAIAASVLVIFGLYTTLKPKTLVIKTLVAETKTHLLPDGSSVQLNANSSIDYNKKEFLKTRTLYLKGEAFFKVAKGSTFTVKTHKAAVSVLGTQFNVIDRGQLFEANCFEGKVAVKNNKFNGTLTPANGIRFLNNVIIPLQSDQKQPQWISKVSSFTRVPLQIVINELQNQYPITIDATGINTNQLITTRFTHTNLKEALISIFEPVNIKATFTTNSHIKLK